MHDATGGVQCSGSRQARPADDFAVVVREEIGARVYRWIPEPGRKVQPEQHVLADRYNRASSGRDAKDDTDRADAGTAAGTLAARTGFAPRDEGRARPLDGKFSFPNGNLPGRGGN
ncbi:hypothetical protein F7Q99_12140 [Streptomyces kaniharaensis]|uniref:Uncharacterized protein n=1 Tax=Streptomyces kaniharaensis TaxID=212423 RepID=A0A6N7KRS0_9ACTN|nr:hypothetical protein [Streptomyces kaniharaensis]MQS13017.1 hypothetical protein [Streptomyces kaniharaensis]